MAHNSMRDFKTNKTSRGFTLVEIMVVIAILGTLLGLAVFSIGNWRTRTAQNEVSSDLNSVGAAMEAARNFSTGYPATIPTTFTASKNVTVTLKSSTATAYCVEAASKVVPTVIYHVGSASKTPVAGVC